MEKTKSSLWFGVYGQEYLVDEPAFFEDSDLPSAELIKKSYEVIKEELAPLMQSSSDELQPYFDDTLQFPPKHWKSIGFVFWGKQDKKLLRRFPALKKLVDELPDCVSISLSMLEPRSVIRPHFGETNAAFRVHLGLSIPASLPECGFTVKNESKAWQDGELLIFLDSNRHAAFNHSEERRYILILDIMRPEFSHLKRYVCVHALSVLSVLFLVSKLPEWFLLKIRGKGSEGRVPKWVYGVALFPFRLMWSLLWLLRAWGVNSR